MKPIIIALLLASSIGCTSQSKQIAVKKDAPVQKYIHALEDRQWCDPKTAGGATNGRQYFYCKPDSNGPEGRKGRITEDVESEQYLNAQEQHKSELADALVTRVLSPKEMKEVLKYGSSLFVRNMQPYRQEEVDQEYLMALKIQAQLREMK